MSVVGDEALVGRVLDDRYQIAERIARGGMASVFRATDQRLDRVVAVKVMHQGLGDDEQFTQRFVREAKSAAKLNHRNVVSVFDQGTDGAVTYLVMEYVPGRTLRDLMREECPMPPRRALALLEQILIALSAAHGAKIIHRDVKPENVLITPDGDVKVADFGLARAVSAATTATGGTLIGTVSYLAPEIVVNEGADARSDVYACGAMLYEMLTGVKPHSGDSPIQIAYKHVHEDIAKPSAAQRGIPPYVDALVLRATVRDRDQRSTDARVMLQQLRQVQRALNAGLEDDPDLTRDLLPGAGPAVPAGEEATVAVGRPELEDTGAMVGLVAADGHEATMQWSGGRPVTPAPPLEAGSAGDGGRSGLHPAMTAEEYAEAKAPKPRRHTGRNLLIVALVLAIVAAGLGWWFADGRYTQAPRLTGMSEADAKTEAKQAGFELTFGEPAFSEEAPAGTIISTDPKAGAKVLPDTTITAVLSLGKDRVKLPKELQGQTLAQATETLKALNLTVGTGTTEVFNDKIPAGGIVRATDYTTETPLKRGTVVNFTVSKGKEPITVVNYVGKTQSEAEAGLKKATFKVVSSQQFSDTVEAGKVISQDPSSGQKFKGDTITLVVSKGRDVVQVPNVVGQQKDQAAAAISAAGLTPVLQDNIFVRGDTIAGQGPNPGETVPRGTSVNLVF